MRTGQGNSWTARRVATLRTTHGIHACPFAEKNGEWLTTSEAAATLGVTNHRIRRLIKDGVLAAEQVVAGAPYHIRACDLRHERISNFAASNVTTTGLTLNWPAFSGATSYAVLARTGAEAKWGSLANTVVSSPSYAFAGLTAGGSVSAIVSPINANGRGPGNETFQNAASS